MKKIIIIFLFIPLLILSSCISEKFQMQQNIVAPENITSPLQGKWIVEDYLDAPYGKGNDKEIESLKGKEVLFHKDAVVIGNDYILEPNYKYKNVNLSDYLLYKYKITNDYLNLAEYNAHILTISSDNQYFHEFIKYKDDEMILFENDKFYFLKQSNKEISKEEVERYIKVEDNIKRISNIEEIDSLRSGVLLGIKSYEKDENNLDNWQYKTIWIRSNNSNITSTLEIKDLLVPRKKGFWMVDVKREDNNGIRDIINSTAKEKLPEIIMEENFTYDLKSARMFTPETKEKGLLKSIKYAGNDYLSVEVTDLTNNQKELKVYPIDYLKEDKAIKISELVGSQGVDTFFEDAQSASKSKITPIINEESFGLSRRNGYWIMKGRINFKENNEVFHKDFNIKLIPPKELVNYDELLIPWNKIKSQIPDAIDAFTSPNDDIILVITMNNIIIYPIENREIKLKELTRIKINPSDEIIMAEWATGRYVNLWEEEVLRNEAQKIEY